MTATPPDAELFLSEVHVGQCPPGIGFWTSKIHLLPISNEKSVEVDGDGDVCLERHRWVIKHCRETPLDQVGGQVRGTGVKHLNVGLFQIWRGSCVMADFVLSRPDLFRNKVVMELGCGVGLVGVALSGVAAEVFLTDHDDIALQLTAENLQRNTETASHVRIRSLDWKTDSKSFASMLAAGSMCGDQVGGSQGVEGSEVFQWVKDDLQAVLSVDVFVAADVIYDEPLTTAFFKRLEQLMRLSQKDAVCYVSLEKRFNFTLDDLDVAAPAYNDFLRYLKTSTESDKCLTERRFKGERLSLEEIPQILNIDRSEDEELWKIQLPE